MLFTNTYVKKKNDTDLNLLFPEEELNYERTAAHYCTPDTGSVRGVERKFDSRKLTIWSQGTTEPGQDLEKYSKINLRHTGTKTKNNKRGLHIGSQKQMSQSESEWVIILST